MLTPSDILDKQFKSGLGYDKKEVEQFLGELSSDYRTLLAENEALTKKQKALDESLGYYKAIEKTLQKALILAEKTAQDTKMTAIKEAETIEAQAKVKASMILQEASKQIEMLEHKTLNLVQQYDLFKIHYENLLHAQLELINSKSFSINTADFSYQEQNEDTSPKLSEGIHTSDYFQEEASEVTKDIIDDIDQITFDFLDTEKDGNYQTEDGFEFFTMNNK